MNYMLNLVKTMESVLETYLSKGVKILVLPMFYPFSQAIALLLMT